jgi:hypothetical protein
LLSLSEFLRTAPAEALRAYFDHRDLTIPDNCPWRGSSRELSTALSRVVDALTERQQSMVFDDAQRLGIMADGPGQEALYSLADDETTDYLDTLGNGYARAVRIFVNAPTHFERAEEVRYTDVHRYGRTWSGYVIDPGLSVGRTEGAMAAFKAAVSERLRSRHVDLEICERRRATLEGNVGLTQVTIYREGRAESRKAFINGQLDRVPDSPVIEAALTYEPGKGIIEAVAGERSTREPLVRLFAENLLGTPVSGEQVKLRQFTLDRLLVPFTFPTEPEDGIEEVRLIQLRLMPLDTAAERITLECQREASRSLWQMAAQRFGEHNPLAAGYIATQAKLSVRFRPSPGTRRARILPVKITMPQGCDLKDRTERERLIGEKYLPRWGLVRSV